MRIGIDFDNTIVSYDQLIYRVAVEWALVPEESLQTKKSIRDQIRRLPDGEDQWQKVQAEIYGPRMREAVLVEGIPAFFSECTRRGVPIYIVSHKTAFANFDRTRTNLREAALGWMQKERFFSPEGFGLSKENVYFESTRAEKIERIKKLDCTHFIDDLEEVFLEPAFPSDVVKILFANQKTSDQLTHVRLISCWEKIQDFAFGSV